MTRSIDDICNFKQNFIDFCRNRFQRKLEKQELKMFKNKFPSLCPTIRPFPIELDNIFNYKLGRNWVSIPIEDVTTMKNFKLERFGIIE